ncbi:MAG TPA: translocation/assembly module TamB domain-containing protein [Anaeromyxobacter sp.]|nr:translocation/assembly module TamB domain-containing protein [Anaeromyxobacter sp.]
MLRGLFWAALVSLALAGLAISAAVAYAGSPLGRRAVASALIRLVSDQVAGKLELGEVEVNSAGTITVRDLRAFDPDGQMVLQVDRLLFSVDVRRLRSKAIGLEVELEGAEVLMQEDEQGRLSLARAFAPAHPAPPVARRGSPAPPWRDPLSGWTIRLRRLTVRRSDLSLKDAAGRTRLELTDLAIDSRAILGPGRGRAEVAFRGEGVSPVPGALELELRVLLDGDRLRVPFLDAQLGGTGVSGTADLDLERRSGRAALTKARVARRQAQELLKGTPSGADLDFSAYAEADGRAATLAVRVEPVAAGGAGGGEAAVAVRLDGSRAVGFEVATKALDPSAVHSAAPKGSVTLSAHGGLAGESFLAARGNLDLTIAPSRLRQGELGPAAAVLRLDRGSWQASRLSISAPGVHLAGSGSYRPGGDASGTFTAEVLDLSEAAGNVSKLLGGEAPKLSGRARIEASLSGSARAPVVSATVRAPALALGAERAESLEARIEASGPFRSGQVRLEARVKRIASGARELARALFLEGALSPLPEGEGTAASLSLQGLAPSLGNEPLSLKAEATLPRGGKAVHLSTLALSYEKARWALEAPATLDLGGPRVDRLALVSGERRIALEGGLAGRRTLDVRLEVEKLDLGDLPAALLPPGEGLAGEISLDARATGTTAHPTVQGQVHLEGGGFRTERGIGLHGTVRYDGAARRVAGKLSLRRGGGGSIDVDAELPLAFGSKGGEPLSATVRAEGLPAAAILALLGQSQPLTGEVRADLRLSGTLASPRLHVEAGVAEGSYRDLAGIEVLLTADAGANGAAQVELALAGRPSLRLEAHAPLSLAALLKEPGRTLGRLGEERVTADADFLGLDLSALSGRLGLPPGVRGELTGQLHLEGPPLAPRGKATLEVAGCSWSDYEDISAHLEVLAKDEGVEARLSARLGAQDLLDLRAALGAPPERLAHRAGLESAALSADATVPAVELERAAGSAGVELGGLVEARIRAGGTLSRPSLDLEASGRSLKLKGRPVGSLHLVGRAVGDEATAEATLDPPNGGRLTATARVNAPLSLDLSPEMLRSRPAEVRVRAEEVDLGFVPAAFPALVRAAAGRFDADLSAAGPLGDLSPRGTVRLRGGRLALIEYGDWERISLDGDITADAIEVKSLEAHRGEGSLELRAALKGLTTQRAQLDGRLETRKLTVSRAGMDVATVTLGVKASGTYQDRHLDARLDLPEGLVRLPDKLPRELQSLEKRPDIIIGARPPPRSTAREVGPPAGRPFFLTARLVSPGKFVVQRESPRVRVELKADVTYEYQPTGNYMSGTVEVVRGTVEPLSDRRFDVGRGRLTFTGGPPQAAVLDIEAQYQATAANITVTVTVTGPVTKPEINLKSQPPMDQGQIALLIATGQTDLRAGAVGGAAASDPARAAAAKAGFAVFNTFIRDQLPFAAGDVSLDASAAKVSGYIPGTKIYVGFTRRFDADRQQGENEDEVRMDYAIAPHWTLEGRWGNANTGGASLIWSKDY